MDTRSFLESVLSPEGYYFSVGASGDKVIASTSCETIDELIDTARKVDSQGLHSYFALATFKEKGTRKGEYAHSFKSFFLDLDIEKQEGNGDTNSTKYPSQEAAVVDLRRFCKEVGLPKPIILNSGRGVHVYWVLEEAVEPSQWLPVAQRLKELCNEKGLRADPAVTSDLARVLRVPYTHNYKTDPPEQVVFFGRQSPNPTSLNEFSKLIGLAAIPITARKVAGSYYSAVQRNLMGNRSSSFKEIMDKTAQGEGCEQLKIIYENQYDLNEPLWRAGLSIAKFCDDGEEAIHEISKEHPEYDPVLTEHKAELIKGPYTCAKIDEFNPNICKNCKHWRKIKSPISLSSFIKESEEVTVSATAKSVATNPVTTFTIPKYPAPYFRGANGGVYKRSIDSEGDYEDKLVYHNDLYIVRRISEAEEGESVVLRLHLPQDGVSEFTIPLYNITSKDELRKSLSKQGVAVTKIDELMNYLVTGVNEMQMNTKVDKAHTQFGWIDNHFTAFALGDRIVTKDDIDFNPPTKNTSGLMPSFIPAGTLDGWKETMRFWNDKKFALQQFAVCAGFGSILMPMTNVHSSSIHFYSSESGVGKTAILKAMLGIYGNPAYLMLQKSDTQNSLFNRAEVMHNMPFTIDEITNMSAEVASDYYYTFSGGKQRNRLQAGGNVERHRGEPWSLISATTGNASMIERVRLMKASPEAETQRVLECYVSRIFAGPESKALTDKFENDLDNNYGHAATPYIQYVIANVGAIRKTFVEVQNLIDERAALSSENRFWSAGVAAAITGGLAAKKIGLIEYDMKVVTDWVVDNLLKSNKAAASAIINSAANVMDDFLSENMGHILHIRSTDKAVSGVDALIIPEKDVRDKLKGRYEPDTKKFFIKPKPLREWCGKNHINYQKLVEAIRMECRGRKSKIRLTRGTNLQLPAADVIEMEFPDEKKLETSKGTKAKSNRT